jgi:hypothetical protein
MLLRGRGWLVLAGGGGYELERFFNLLLRTGRFVDYRIIGSQGKYSALLTLRASRDGCRLCWTRRSELTAGLKVGAASPDPGQRMR